MRYTDMYFNHKTVLITHRAGFIGSHLALYSHNNDSISNTLFCKLFQSDILYG